MTKYRYHLIDAVAAFALLLMVLLRAGQKLDHSGVAEMDALNVHDLAIQERGDHGKSPCLNL